MYPAMTLRAINTRAFDICDFVIRTYWISSQTEQVFDGVSYIFWKELLCDYKEKGKDHDLLLIMMRKKEIAILPHQTD